MFALLVATCLSFSEFDQILRSTGKQQVWRGVNENRTTMNIVYSDENGAWVVLAVNPDGRACEMGSGKDSEVLIQKIGADINAK
tara:strand:+ start:3533 stop:3784 length:252 start_codon:yes stop_codon:yes gene_type:complete